MSKKSNFVKSYSQPCRSSCFEHSSLNSRVASIPGGRDADGQSARAHVSSPPRTAPRRDRLRARRARRRNRAIMRELGKTIPPPRWASSSRAAPSASERARATSPGGARPREGRHPHRHPRADPRGPRGTPGPSSMTTPTPFARRSGRRARRLTATPRRARTRARRTRRSTTAVLRYVAWGSADDGQVRRGSHHRSIARTARPKTKTKTKTQNQNQNQNIRRSPVRIRRTARAFRRRHVGRASTPSTRDAVTGGGGDGGRCALFAPEPGGRDNLGGRAKQKLATGTKVGTGRGRVGDGGGGSRRTSAGDGSGANRRRCRTAHRGWCSQAQFFDCTSISIATRDERPLTCSPPAAWTARCARGPRREVRGDGRAEGRGASTRERFGVFSMHHRDPLLVGCGIDGSGGGQAGRARPGRRRFGPDGVRRTTACTAGSFVRSMERRHRGDAPRRRVRRRRRTGANGCSRPAAATARRGRDTRIARVAEGRG